MPRPCQPDHPVPHRKGVQPMLSLLKAGLDRFDDTPAADIIGVVILFAAPFAVLLIGCLIDGGM